MNGSGLAWSIERREGHAADLHLLPDPDRPQRVARVFEVDRPAIVLGSAQRNDVVDEARAEQAGIDVVRRRSGGGAVLLRPAEQIWIDFLIPAGDRLWHDGRFADPTRVEDSIVAHNEGFNISQAAPAADAFVALNQGDKDAVLAFLDSLGQREFDFTGDDNITIEDFHGFSDPAAFAECYGLGPYTPDHACAIHDIDQDTDVDDDDFKAFLTVYVGPMSDCNTNTVLDLIDILHGTSLDTNRNGIPDECEPTCVGDLDGSGDVGVPDILILLGSWGDCPALPAPCPADHDNSGTVDVIDLLNMLAKWGPC